MIRHLLSRAPGRPALSANWKRRAARWAPLLSASVLPYITLASADTLLALPDTVLSVGKDAEYRTISDAVEIANRDRDPTHSYSIVVAPGLYTDDFPHVTRPLTIRAQPTHVGQDVILRATKDIPNGKGIILSEADLVVDGLTFERATIHNHLGGNAAGIRFENMGDTAKLIVQNSIFVSNQNGILTSENPSQRITISHTQFKNNGNASIQAGTLCCQHAIYISKAATLDVIDSFFCGQLVGHDIKSRAAVNSVSRSVFIHGTIDGHLAGCEEGSPSFAIDLPNGGKTDISQNKIIQGVTSRNKHLIAYGEEGLLYKYNHLFIRENEFVSNLPNATAIYNPHCSRVKLTNNTLSGVLAIVNPSECAL